MTTKNPLTLLLATDLGPSSDRALNRALQLAKQCESRIIGLHVLNLRKDPDQTLAWAKGSSDLSLKVHALKQLNLDLSSSGVKFEPRISDDADIAACITKTATETAANLVVTGSPGGGYARFKLGNIVGSLAKSLPTPLLVVRNQAREPYHRVLVATDFSQASRSALLTAATLFPGCQMTLYHCVHALHLGGGADTPAIDHAPLAHQVLQDCLTNTPLPEEVRSNLKVVIESGDLESMITRHVRDHEIDLVVIGNSSKDILSSALLGSSAESLLTWLPCDVMVVRASVT